MTRVTKILAKGKCIFSTILFLSLTAHLAGQDSAEEIIYIGFNEHSSSSYISEGELDKKYKSRSYLKNISAQGVIKFYVEGLLFLHDPDKMESTTLGDIAEIRCEILSPAGIKEHIDQIREVYPMGYNFDLKEFPRLFIVDKSEGNARLYEVRWQPYIKN